MPCLAAGGLKAPVERTADLDGPGRYLDFGGEGQPLVLLHGLGGAAENWLAVGAALSKNHRVLAPDLRGHGRTLLSGHPARINDHQRYLDAFLRQVAGVPAVVVGSSMGALISVLQAAREPATISALLLVDPALPWAGRRRFDFAVWAAFGSLLLPGVAERGLPLRRRRLGAERSVRESLAMICADPGRVPPEVFRTHVELLEEQRLVPDYSRALVQSGRSILRMLASLRFDPIYRALECPVCILHGDRDRLVPVEFSLGLGQRYGWPVEVLPGVGHGPMMEVPDLFSQTALKWLRTPALRSA